MEVMTEPFRRVRGLRGLAALVITLEGAPGGNGDHVAAPRNRACRAGDSHQNGAISSWRDVAERNDTEDNTWSLRLTGTTLKSRFHSASLFPF